MDNEFLQQIVILTITFAIGTFFIYLGHTIKCYGSIHDDVITTSIENIVHQDQYCSEIFVESHSSVAKKFGYQAVVKNKQQLPKFDKQARLVPIFHTLVKKKSCQLKIINLDEEEPEQLLKDLNLSSIPWNKPDTSSMFEQDIQENANYFGQQAL